MTRVLMIRLAVIAIGIVFWGYGISVDDVTFRWIGMGVLLVALLMRFLPARWFGDV